MRREDARKMGCTTVILLSILAGTLLRLAGVSLDMLPPATAVAVFVLFVILSDWEDRRKSRSIGRCVDCFEQQFPSASADRDLAITELHAIADESKHSYYKSAKQLIIELGVSERPLPKPAEGVLNAATAALKPATEPLSRPPAKTTDEQPAPREVADPPRSPVPSRHPGRRGAAHIPLEPEADDPGSSRE